MFVKHLGTLGQRMQQIGMQGHARLLAYRVIRLTAGLILGVATGDADDIKGI